MSMNSSQGGEGAINLTGLEFDGLRIESLLGRGGMGEVYKATDLKLERPVAVKIIPDFFAADPEFSERFEREAKAASALNHPNIAHIYATGTYGKRPYFVMEYIEGKSLADLLDDQGRVSGLKCISYLTEACEGLRAAHERGIIHRDIKPDNLMIDARDHLKIVDFGLARRLGSEHSITKKSMVVGTPRYMAPEQALAEDIDHRSDIYSLGATFYHLFAGVAPFEAPTPVGLMMRHVNDPLPPLRQHNPRIPQGICEIIEKMMAKQRDDRYQSYETLIRDLKLAQAGASRLIVGQTMDIRPPVRTPNTPTGFGLGSGAAVHSAVPIVSIGVFTVLAATALILAYNRSSESPPAESPNPDQASALASRGNNADAYAIPAFLPASREGAVRRLEARPGGNTTLSESGGRAESSEGDSAPLTAGAQLPFPQVFDPTAMITMAVRAKTLANMRKLSTSVEVYAAEHEDVPVSIAQIVKFLDLHPLEALDGWKRPILYEVRGPRSYRLMSAGQDGRTGSADDVVMENGVVVQGDMEFSIPGTTP